MPITLTNTHSWQLPGVVPLDAPDLPPFTNWRWVSSFRDAPIITVILYIVIKAGPALLTAALVALAAYVFQRLR